MFRETKGAYALEVEARDGAPSARPNSGGQPNTGKTTASNPPLPTPPALSSLTSPPSPAPGPRSR